MLNFWLQNIAYVLYILLGFAFLAMGWLHLDAHRAQSKRSDLFRAASYLFIALGMLCEVFAQNDLLAVASFVFMAIGLSLLIVSLRQEPILPSNLEQLVSHEGENKQMHAVSPIVLAAFPILNVVLAMVAVTMLRSRYLLGKVKEYKLLVWVFGLVALSELLKASSVLAGSDIIVVQEIFSKFSIVWLVRHIALVAALALLAKWLWKYIKFRPKPELFLAFITIAVVVSTLGAMLYSSFLFARTESEVLGQLQKDVNVLRLAVSSLEDNALTTANLLARNPQITASLAASDYRTLYDSALVYAEETVNIDSIIITDNSGQVLVQTDNQSFVGQSMSDDQLVLYAINEAKERVNVSIEPGVLADKVHVRAAHPVLSADQTPIGVVIVGFVLDDAFVDNVKAQTGLEVTVYAGDKRSSTTLFAPDGLSRRENTTDTNTAVVEQVLKQGKDYSGNVAIVNEQYHGAYAPLTDTNGQTIGMLFVGRPQQLLLDAIDSAMVNTFILSIAVSLLAVFPAAKLAKSIEKSYQA